MITLIDDGTLDTVLRCEECGEEFRFSYAYDPTALTYEEFVQECKLDVLDDHECFPLDLEVEVEDEDEDLYFEDTESVPDATGTSEGLEGDDEKDS